MAEENTAQAGAEIQDPADQTTTQSGSGDYETLYSKEIENAKAQRKRAQKAEARLAEIELANEETRKAKLQQDGEHTVLIKELEEKVVALDSENKGYRERDEAERLELIETFPETERDNIKHLDLKALKSLNNMVGSQRTENPPVAPGTVSGKKYTLDEVQTLPPKERADAWKQVVADYQKKDRAGA